MSVAPGTRIGHYEILTPIGAGGMGEVFKASDTKLKRDVALKVLPAAVSRDSERLARFQREAEVLASLNHPNIAAIYGVEHDGDTHALAMEFVDGASPKGPLPFEEAWKVCSQIADALSYAHDKGVVHRDLKPANVKVTPDGVVKLLDFGLAKAFAARTASDSGAPATNENSPTLTIGATEVGMILGTAAYMSPEQAKGKSVDKRADIWAFGIVLYELLTGTRPFHGDEVGDILASVIKEQPDLEKIPAQVRPLIERCLEKDPKKRLRDIGDVALLLERTPQEAASSVSSRPARWLWVVTAAALAGLAALGFVHGREAPPPLQAVQFAMEPPPNMRFIDQYGAFAVSPDGRSLVFAAAGSGQRTALLTGQGGSLWLRSLDSATARMLPGTEGGNFPTWSPDSKSLVFRTTDNKLKRVEIDGGTPLTLCNASNDSVTPTGTWNHDGVILFGSRAGLQQVFASGGGASPLTKIDPAKKETGHGYPQFLPNGDQFLYFVASNDPNVQGVYASSLSKPGERKQILRTDAKAVYVPPRAERPGYLLWMQERILLAQRFDASTLRLDGAPTAVAQEIGRNPASPIRAAFWASDSGLLIYVAGQTEENRSMFWYSRNGKPLGEAAPAGDYRAFSISPNSDRVAMDRDLQDVWVRELSRGVMTRLTFDRAADTNPIWSPDGRQIAFSSTRDRGVAQIYWKDSSGAGQEERLTDGPYAKTPLDWSHDGRYILYREDNPETGRDLLALPLEGDRKPIVVVRTKFNESTAALSPDGRWVAYASNDSGRYELYVQAFPGIDNAPKGRWQISSGGAYQVRWRGDGKELYYGGTRDTLTEHRDEFQAVAADGSLMAVTVQLSSQAVHAETARELFKIQFLNGSPRELDVTADGQRFMVLGAPSEQNAIAIQNPIRLTVVSNWQATLKK